MIRRAVRSRRMLVRNRTPKFLSGRAFTAQEIQDIQETIETCGLPWTELVYTVCEHLDWVTPTGRYKEKSRSEEHTSELQSRLHLVCRLLLEKKKNKFIYLHADTF